MFAFRSAVSHQEFGHLAPRDVPSLPATVRIIDVREPHEYRGDLGHIPRSELVPLRTLTAAVASWNQEDDIVVVCHAGGRSSQAAATLKQLGFRRVRNLDGGMVAYVQAGMPVERAP